MPFSRPTLQQIAARVKLDLQGALSGTAAFFRHSFERASGNALAGVSHGLHAHLDWLARQINPLTADDDIVETVHGAPWGVNKKEAVATRLTIVSTGSSTNGTIVPAGTVYTRSDAVAYTVDAPGGTVAGGIVSLNITAQIPAAAGNAGNGTILTIGSPIAGLTSTATVTSTLESGSDREDPTVYLGRVVLRRQTPPKGGAEGDYLRWALEVAGVTRGWELPRLEGPGTVTLYLVNDEGIPITLDGSKLTEVATYLDQAGRQPTTVDAFVRTPTLYTIPMSIAISPNTSAVREAVELEIDDFFNRDGTPEGQTITLSQLNEAISIAPGEETHQLTFPTGDLAIPVGSLPVRGVISWSSL
jgi:uncharacterized phage protein gp47/JayE